MKKGWVTKTLGEVCEILDSRRVPITKRNRKNGFIPYYGATGQVDSVAEYLFDERLLLLGEDGADWSAGANSAYIIEGKSWVNNHAHVLKPFPGVIYDVWLLHYLNSADLTKWVSGAVVPKLTQKNMCDIPIPIPPLEEQKRIVAKIDAAFEKIDKLKANAEKNLANAKALFQSALDEAMRPQKGWEEKRLGEVCRTTSGGTPIKSRPEYYEGGTIPWLRSGEVCRKEITESELFITELGMKNSSAKMMPKDTVLIAMYGATAAQSGILRFESTTNQAICGILPCKEFLPEFLYYYFKKIESQLAARAQGGAQPNISQQKIKETLVPMISLMEQEAIVKSLDIATGCVEVLEQNYTKQIADCAEMRQAVLREAFEGRL